LGPQMLPPIASVAAMQADDFVAVCCTLEEARAVAQTVYEYGCRWHFRLNAKKSAVMHVAPHRQRSTLTESGICWNGNAIPVVSEYCYLGLWFQNDCSWNVHFVEMMKKAERRKSMLMPVWKSRHISVEVKRIIMLTCVRPIVEYGAEVWAPATVQKWTAIDRLQSDIIKIAMRNAHEKPCTHALLAEWGVKPMHMWMHARAMEYFFRIKRMPDERWPKQVLNATWVLSDLDACVLPWQKYVSGLFDLYSVDDQSLFADSKRCKTFIKKQVMLRYSDIVLRDMVQLSSLQRYVQFVNPGLLQRITFDAPRPYLCVWQPSLGVELMMRVRLGCLSVHERTARYARRVNASDEDLHQLPCPACGAPVESIAHLMFDCPVTSVEREAMYDVLKASADDAAKLEECLAISCPQQKVARFVSCNYWKNEYGGVTKAIADYLGQAWKIRNMHKHGGAGGAVVDDDSARNGRGADGTIAMA